MDICWQQRQCVVSTYSSYERIHCSGWNNFFLIICVYIYTHYVCRLCICTWWLHYCVHKGRGCRDVYWGNVACITTHISHCCSYVTSFFRNCNLSANNNYTCVGCKVLTAVVIRSSACWEITSYSLLKINRLFGLERTFYLHIHGQKLSQTGNKQVWLCLLRHWKWRWHSPSKSHVTSNGL
jgi:hypothetical protein